MKITALYDARGVILAGVAIDEEDDPDAPVLVPVASRGTKIGVFDVPDYAGKGRIDEICTSLRVDVRSQRLVEARQPAARRAPKRAGSVRKRKR